MYLSCRRRSANDTYVGLRFFPPPAFSCFHTRCTQGKKGQRGALLWTVRGCSRKKRNETPKHPAVVSASSCAYFAPFGGVFLSRVSCVPVGQRWHHPLLSIDHLVVLLDRVPPFLMLVVGVLLHTKQANLYSSASRSRGPTQRILSRFNEDHRAQPKTYPPPPVANARLSVAPATPHPRRVASVEKERSQRRPRAGGCCQGMSAPLPG